MANYEGGGGQSPPAYPPPGATPVFKLYNTIMHSCRELNQI